MITVLPDVDDDFEEEQTPRIVGWYREYFVDDLKIDESVPPAGGSFLAKNFNFLTELKVEWILYPSAKNIFITNSDQRGHDTFCQFEFRP